MKCGDGGRDDQGMKVKNEEGRERGEGALLGVVERSWDLPLGCRNPGSAAYQLCDLPQNHSPF